MSEEIFRRFSGIYLWVRSGSHRLLSGLVLWLSLLCAGPMAAQSAPNALSDDSAQVHGAVVVRTFTSLLGWIPGAAVGGYIGNHVPRSHCNCDDPGLKEILIGMAAGGALGAAIGSSAPRLNGRCSFARRFGLGLIGSAVGAGVGMIRITRDSPVLTVPVFSILGAAIFEWPC